ncbi:hypothetical protein AAC387_Pa02g0803 [Persea americana]
MEGKGSVGFSKRRAEGRNNKKHMNLQLKTRKLNPVNSICYVQIDHLFLTRVCSETAGGLPVDLKAMEEEVLGLKGKIKKLDSVVMAGEKEAKTAEAIAEALMKQSKDLLLEYDRLQEDNQNICN